MADNWLIFVDTNIYLDFYRVSGESAKRQMEALERHKDSLIVSEQVRMEFLKNRQKVILKAFEAIKKPTKTTVPQIIAESEPARLLRKSEKETDKRYKELKQRIENLLSRPANYDDVLKSFNRIFKANTQYNLKRPNKTRLSIRNQARKRFSLGYPPRKANDTSIGDAINWEWIVECASNSPANCHVLIVSRDGDYGAQFDNQSYLNDWLVREFKERLTKRRKVELTTKLTDALKLLDEQVAEEDEQEEEELISGRRRELTPGEIWRYINRPPAARVLNPDPDMEDYLEEISNKTTGEHADSDTKEE